MRVQPLAYLLAATSVVLGFARGPELIDLGEDISPYDVSADGSVVVGNSTFGLFGSAAFRWTRAGGFVELPPPPGSQNIVTQAWGVSADGQVVVGIHNDGLGPQAFRWTAKSGMVVLGDLPGGEVFAHAYAASHDGAIVVGFGATEYSERIEAFRWTAETGMVGMGDLDGGFFLSWARDITPDGRIVIGESVGPVTYEAFRWTEQTGMVGLGGFPGAPYPYTRGFAVSADSSTIVGDGRGISGLEAFRWTADEGVIGLGDLPGGIFGSSAADVSGDGSLIIGSGSGPTGSEPVVWDAQRGMRGLSAAMRDEYGIDLTGWKITGVTAISDDGRTIVGTMYPLVPNSDNHGFVFYLGNPPCAGDLDGDGAIGMTDLQTLLANFGITTGAEPEDGDLDADGDVDLPDLATLLSLFGESCE